MTKNTIPENELHEFRRSVGLVVRDLNDQFSRIGAERWSKVSHLENRHFQEDIEYWFNMANLWRSLRKNGTGNFPPEFLLGIFSGYFQIHSPVTADEIKLKAFIDKYGGA